MKALFAIMLAGLMLAAQAHAQIRPGPDTLDPVLAAEGATGAILVRRLSDGAEWTGGERVDQRFLPASTFKIVNSLIILETAAVSDRDADVVAWDGVERSPGWDQDQTLRTAFRRSAVWAFQHWAREVGHARMSELVARLNYGNARIGEADEVDRFGLGRVDAAVRDHLQVEAVGRSAQLRQLILHLGGVGEEGRCPLRPPEAAGVELVEHLPVGLLHG